MFTYIIWSPQGEKPPTATFTRRWAAENEAQRLSLAHPNQVFHVCKIKSATVAGQSAYFGKWRPKKWKQPWQNWKPAEEVNVAVSEADLIDEPLCCIALAWRGWREYDCEETNRISYRAH